MNCQDARRHFVDLGRDLLEPGTAAEVRAHIDGCVACAREMVADRALSDLLEERLPQYAAPIGLKRRLAASWPPRAASPRPRWWHRSLLPAAAAALILLAAVPMAYRYGASSGNVADMTAEAVNDHLRLLSSTRPLDVENSGMHQVKPWFEGRLDFAPVVPFAGDADFPLQGGAVGYFLDRKAAAFVYHRRLHAISLLVFRAEGLPWPSRGAAGSDRGEPVAAATRGFNVLLWRRGDLGYALVSDLDAAELRQLATKLGGSL